MSVLFQTFDFHGLRLRNRVIMAPMTRSRAGPGDAPTVMNAEYYAQRASCGLIITEAIVVSQHARGYLFTPGIYTEDQVTGWRLVTEAVHNKRGLIFAQLWHVGRVSHHSILPNGEAPMGPTSAHESNMEAFAITDSGKPGPVPVSPPRALRTEEIKPIVDEFVQATKRALRSGFDGVEILAANGYLFDQFLNSAVNTRTDAYGGQSPQNRVRLLLEVVDAICDEVKGVRLGVRLSPFGTFNNMPHDDKTEETFLHIAKELDFRDVAYVHFNDEPVSIGHLNQFSADNVGDGDAALFRQVPPCFIRGFKTRFSGPVMLCGALTAKLAEPMLNEGLIDLAVFGIPYIANPDLPERMLHGWELTSPKTDLFYGGGAEGYIDYAPYTNEPQ